MCIKARVLLQPEVYLSNVFFYLHSHISFGYQLSHFSFGHQDFIRPTRERFEARIAHYCVNGYELHLRAVQALPIYETMHAAPSGGGGAAAAPALKRVRVTARSCTFDQESVADIFQPDDESFLRHSAELEPLSVCIFIRAIDIGSPSY
jgi:hypothetical protein